MTGGSGGVGSDARSEGEVREVEYSGKEKVRVFADCVVGTAQADGGDGRGLCRW